MPKLLQAVYGMPAPATPRNDLVSGVPDRRAGTQSAARREAGRDAPSEHRHRADRDPARLGVLAGDIAGFPNGRRLTDDVIDITLQAAAGVARRREDRRLATAST